MYKLIVTDMDGTLLNTDKTISQYNREKLKEAMDNGVHFAVATGRVYGTARLPISDMPYEGFLISSNGAVVTNQQTNERIQSIAIEKETAFRVIDVCRKRNMYFHIYTETAIYSEQYGFIVERFTKQLEGKALDEKIVIGVLNDCKLIFDKEVVNKIAIMSNDRSEIDQAMEEINEGGKVNSFMSLATSCDIMGQGVNKASGIEAICKYYGIDKSEVIAMGDNENDLDMIKYAGLGVAMENALEHVKSEADYITDTNDNSGFGKVIEKFILEKL